MDDMPCIISVAITGSVPRKRDNRALPVSVAEQVESTHAACEAGAALVHVHVRNGDETPSSDPGKFAAFQHGIRRHCPDMAIQFCTGGRGRAPEARGAMLHLRPDMASLATGSVDFPTIVYGNPPDFVRSLAAAMRDQGVKPGIEVFDFAMLCNTAELVAEGLIRPPPHVQFVLGVKHARPRAARHPGVRGGEAARDPARRHLDRGRHRAAPVRGGGLGPRHGRTLPHGPRGQHPHGPDDARALQRRARRAGGGDGGGGRPPGCNRRPGA